MSDAGPISQEKAAMGTQEPPPSTASLSPEARALLAELNMNPPQAVLPERDTPAASIRPGGERAIESGIVLAPHQDAHATAFADLLDHIEDSDGAMHVDEKAALAAVARFEQQKQMRPQPSDMMTADRVSGMSDVGGGPADADDGDGQNLSGVTLGSDFDASINADFASMGGDANDDNDEASSDRPIDADFGDDLQNDFEEDFDFDLEDEKPSLLARLTGRGGGVVRRLVGFKDASSAYDAQSGASLLPFTIIRAVVLVLVAAVPPLINLIIIQPQISDNNRKLTQIRSFEAKSQEDKKVADDLAQKIARAQKASKRRIAGLMPESEAQELINRYLEALQQFEVDLLSYNVTSDLTRKVISGSEVQDATMVEMDLVSRYDIYTDIRKIFVAQANNIIIVDEAFEAQPDSLKLRVNAKFMLPTYRTYDSELDTPVEEKEEEKE